jgi:hypothetical protein
MSERAARERWVDHLDEEDLVFLRRFIVLSGSLKDTAAAYGISYPTVRLRLDRLIDKIKIVEREEAADEFERTLRALFADGRLDEPAFRTLLAAHRGSIAGGSP